VRPVEGRFVEVILKFSRASGILLHPTSLPGRFGIGDFGDEAYRFVDFLYESGQHLWQVLPLGPTGFGDSPYQCLSAFAGNTCLVSPELLVREGLLSMEQIRPVPRFPRTRVDYGRVIAYKRSMLGLAWERFKADPDQRMAERFFGFCRGASAWLDDYALFRALKDAHGGAPWNEWEPGYSAREGAALLSASDKLRDRIGAERFAQFLFFSQWSALREYCRDRRISIIGDMPIFVAYDSADVWTDRELFKLDVEGRPLRVAGVPPDYFSATGQLWGNPLYDWDRMKRNGFGWWVARFKESLAKVDIVRLDHFRGFAACWEVPANEETAELGHWVAAPGREIFATLKDEFGELPIIAEDLGLITPDVEALRDEFNLSGMRVLQFAFQPNGANPNLPHNHVPNCVVYTGTHDNDTTIGWFRALGRAAGSTREYEEMKKERAFCLQYLRSKGTEINWDFVWAAFASVADLAIVPLQDVLGLDSRARMNVPASERGNWGWRFRDDVLTRKASDRLREITELFGRDLSSEDLHPPRSR
jgi:4-alpha-glucanotransferase